MTFGRMLRMYTKGRRRKGGRKAKAGTDTGGTKVDGRVGMKGKNWASHRRND